MKLEHKVTFRWLLLFALPTILSSIFSYLYTTVDGIFVARWVDTDALSAINITMPMIYLASALGMMFGTGGNALVAKKLGEGKQREAQENFSLLMLVAFVLSVVLAIVCFIFLNPLCRFLGSDTALLSYCRQYMIPVLISVPFAVFGMVFQLSFITVGKAGLGATLSVIGGVLNIVLDWLFISVFQWGLAGAAIATSIGYAFPSVVGVIWFCVNRKQILHVVRPKWRIRTIIDSCVNGSSEMVSVLAFSVITILFNRILLNLGGSDGVASLSIIWYAQGLFGGMFRGYINGIASVVSYNFGRKDKEQLAKVFRISVWTLGITGIAVMILSFFAGGTVVDFFAKNNENVQKIALHGFRIVATSFPMLAYNVFGSGWFTALNDGKTSAILSFCRTVIFMVIPVLILPQILEMDGVWLSITAGEMLSIIMTIYYFVKYKGMWKVNS
uniref:MATE family efflux transporter n=1 Tax=Agathobacter sp. TaxID=2021311 RepID=UPI003FEF5F2C